MRVTLLLTPKPGAKEPGPWFSASQVSTYEMCPRKWGHRYLDGREAPSNRFASFGTAVHDEQIAPWFLKRRLPDDSPAGKVAAKIIQHLPSPQREGLVVEKEIRLLLDGNKFVGKIDLWNPDKPLPSVYDHKTTSDLRWAKTPDDLIVDPQATLYAAWGLMESDSPSVRLQWTYGTTGSRPRSLPVVREVGWNDITPRLSKTTETAKQMAAAKAGKLKAADLVADASACNAFGGCPYKSVCPLSEEEKVRSFVAQEQARAAFLAKMQNWQAAKGTQGDPGINPPDGPTGQPPAPTAPQGPPPPPAANGTTSLRERLAARASTGAAPSPAPPATDPPATPAASAEPEAPTGGEEEKRGRGRPRGAKNKPKTTPAEGGYTLYVDCSPVKLPSGAPQPEYANDRIARVMTKFTEATMGVEHYRLGEGEKLGFGKGVAIFAGLVAQDLAEDPPDGAVVLTTASPEARDCLHVFASAAHTVVQG